MVFSNLEDMVDKNTVLERFLQRSKQELEASESITPEILSRLNISIECLPQKCRQMLSQASKHQNITDPISISLENTRNISETLHDDYEILKLKQKNNLLQIRIERNRKEIDGLRRDLVEAKKSLQSKNPNPENIGDHIKQIQMKVASYSESCEKAKNKLAKLSVPECIQPKVLQNLIDQLAELKTQEVALCAKAEDIKVHNQIRDQLHSLRRMQH